MRSEAPVASYVADLAAAEPTASGVRSLLLSGARTWRVRGAVYCCYDVIRRQDLRVHVSIPGSVRATVLAPAGKVATQDPPPAAHTASQLCSSAPSCQATPVLPHWASARGANGGDGGMGEMSPWHTKYFNESH